MFQLSHRFAILHRARWYNCRALFKVNDSIIEIDVIDSRVFAKFEIQINFGWMTYMSTVARLLSVCINPGGRICSVDTWDVSGVAHQATWLVHNHDDVIKWKHFPRYWPFVRRSPVNSPHKAQWRRALMFSLIKLINEISTCIVATFNSRLYSAWS